MVEWEKTGCCKDCQEDPSKFCELFALGKLGTDFVVRGPSSEAKASHMYNYNNMVCTSPQSIP